MRRVRPFLAVISCVLGLNLFVALPFLVPTAGAARYANLNPGGPADLTETVPVNIVLVGYSATDVNAAALTAALPQRSKPVIRSRLWYGTTEYVGLSYTYQYNVVYADAAYQQRFFSYLGSAATAAPLTVFQQQYNDQQRNVRDLADNNLISAPDTERWLALNPPAGIDTTRNTVYLVNWWGNGATPRAGFKNHVYAKLGEPDPDTGFDFGTRSSRKLFAWGGTTADDPQTGLGSTRRVWFFDLSAGPVSDTDNWNVDTPDLDSDGVEDYRLPPIWEYYAPNGYRAASALTGDLAKVVRYVAINLLFTPSPIYPPGYTPQRLPNTINLDFNVYEGIPNVRAAQRYLKGPFARDKISKLHRVPYTYDIQSLPLTGVPRQCYYRWAALYNGVGPDTPCYPDYGQYSGFANIFLDHALNLARVRDGGGDYEALQINYAVNDAVPPPLLGIAEDNYLDGTQSLTVNLVSPELTQFGYGLTTTNIHEYGHHLALSHPFDGYDSETDVDYGPSGPYAFAFAGNEVNSMMSYIDLNWDFSQFDRDNVNRFYAAAYIANANKIAADILASPSAGAASAELSAADSAVAAARSALSAHNYPTTFDQAKLAYEQVRAGAAKAGVTVNASQRGVFVEAPAGRAPQPKRTTPHPGAVDRLGPDSHRLRP